MHPDLGPSLDPGLDPELASPWSVLAAEDADGQTVFLEVQGPTSTPPSAVPVSAPQDSGIRVCWRGQQFLAKPHGSSLTLQHVGPQLLPNDPLWQRLPGWQKVAGSPAAPAAKEAELSNVRVVYSLQQLKADVRANPSRWVDGTAPGDGPLVGLDHATLCAGELAALLAGLRGAVMVQLHVGWAPVPCPPAYNPLVVPLLREAAARPDVTIIMSTLTGGAGVTALMSAAREPWSAWCRGLAAFGAQAALVAQSPYYKLLIGTAMGYRPENITHHIRENHGRGHPTTDEARLVAEELRRLSRKKPTLPWDAPPSSRGKNAKRR